MKAVEQEIAAEKASNLGRVGEKLEAALAELATLARAVTEAAPAERAARVAAYNACRRRAEDAYYWLTVQREAMGVISHELLAALYPIPPKLK